MENINLGFFKIFYIYFHWLGVFVIYQDYDILKKKCKSWTVLIDNSPFICL